MLPLLRIASLLAALMVLAACRGNGITPPDPRGPDCSACWHRPDTGQPEVAIDAGDAQAVPPEDSGPTRDTGVTFDATTDAFDAAAQDEAQP